MIKLTCPSCGGSLELPDKNGIYHCMYCATKIIVDQTQVERDIQHKNQFKELCKTALEMKNYEEVRDFANKILELDTKEAEAWIMKGVGTFYCDPEKDAAFFEAVGYLRKAHSLNPDNSETLKWRSILCNAYGLQKNTWGMKEFNTARAIFARNDQKIDAAVILEMEEHFTKAMNYFLVALKFAPNSITIMNNIRNCERVAREMAAVNHWPEEVRVKIGLLNQYERKKEAAWKFPELGRQIKQKRAEIQQLNRKKNLFASFQQKMLEDQLKTLLAEAKCEEEKLRFEFPPSDLEW